MTDHPPKPRKDKPTETRKERLQAALRANLKRRKDQARRRNETKAER